MHTLRQFFSTRSRLLTKEDYSNVFNHSEKKASNRYALLLAFPHSGPHHSRLGLIVAKKNVRSAVDRNRVKRLVREHFRRHPQTQTKDTIFMARKGIADLSNSEIRYHLQQLWAKLDTVAAHP